MADVNADALAGGSKRAQGVANVNVNLSRVGLTGDDECGIEASLLGDKLVQLFNLGVVSVEDLEERSLSTGGTLDTTEAQVITGPLQVPQIHEQVLDPETGSLSDSDKLSGLAVSETKARQVLILLSERGQLVDDNSKLGNEDIETVTEEDQIRIVRAVARSGTPVNDASGGGRDLTVSMDVSHDIVPAALFLLSSNLELFVLNGKVGLHLLNGIIGDRQAELYDVLGGKHYLTYGLCKIIPFSDSASHSQSFLQVEKRFLGEKRYFISSPTKSAV